MCEKESTSESGHILSTRNDIPHIIRETLIDLEEDKLRGLIDDRCEKVMTFLFQRARRRATGNALSPIYEIMKNAAAKIYFSGGADELLDEHLYKRGESQVSKRDLVIHRIGMSIFTISVARSVKEQSEKAVASKALIRQENIRNVTVEKEVTAPSSLTGHLPKFAKTSKVDKQKKAKKKSPSHNHSKYSSWLKYR